MRTSPVFHLTKNAKMAKMAKMTKNGKNRKSKATFNFNG